MIFYCTSSTPHDTDLILGTYDFLGSEELLGFDLF